MTTSAITVPVFDLVGEADAALLAAEVALQRAARVAGEDPHARVDLVALAELLDGVRALRC